MVNINFKPIEEVVILEEIRFDNPQDFFKDLRSGAPPGATVTALWAEGIVFRHQGLPLNVEPVVKERMEGKVYWSSVKYAEMPEFKESASVGRETIGIAKAGSPTLKEIAKELRSRIKESG
ncbi:hypothetical protein AKJ45_03065 [candidate division MSBL1 archaeon SCGC-AAA261F19]|uniref:Uncharacterized protein n=1 Tax=candidate division MSBL1 archaeon SCGC-AAA261F19 TaxID=1698275 RepID=A0A133V931_9EURY|nr:hypothetical protein AKJ45_03065 [candidate division MSBL1 archaeon SCGC-AAA261F19]